MDFFNSKRKKVFFQRLADQYGYSGSTDIVLFEGGEDKIYAVSLGVRHAPLNELGVMQGGLYVANTKGESLRLTLDGARFFGDDCSEVISVSQEQKDAWMRGENISYTGKKHGYVLVAYDSRIIGCGSVANDGYIKNYVPKGRRIQDPHHS